MGLTALVPGGLAAQDATPAAYTQPVVTEELRQLEIREGVAAVRGSAEFARSCETCVGIEFSKGDDFRKSVYDRAVAYLNERGAPLSENNMEVVSARVEALILQHYEQEYARLFAPMGVQTKMFNYTDYASTEGNIVRSGVNFHVGQVVYENTNGKGSFLLSEVDAELAVDVVDMLSYMWKNDPELVSQLNPSPSLVPIGG